MTTCNYTRGAVKKILELEEYWKQYEHDDWLLISFDERQARFGWDDKKAGMYTKYITVREDIVSFLQGVTPAAKDVGPPS